MKKIKLTTAAVAILLALTFTSCKDSKKQSNETVKQTEMEHKKMAVKYACPMKCEGDKTYDAKGSCPKCGMDLKEVKAQAKAQEDHSGHNH